jgi:tetratricopeptide (TPR) repeat protein
LAQKPAVPGHSYAVLIGVQDYSGSGLNELTHASKDTDLFMNHLHSDRGGGLDVDKNIKEFVTPGARGAAKNQILAALSQIITKEAGGNDVVYVLITARSDVPLQSDEIFINVAKSLREKQDSQISLTELHKVLQENRDARKVVFAELSGNPSARGPAEIGDRVKRRLALENLTGVLGAESESALRDTTDSNGGHRVFPYLLVSGLQTTTGKFEGFPVDLDSDHLISFAEIRNFLEKYLPEYTRRLKLNHGIVQRFGDQNAPDLLLSNLTKPGLTDLAWKPARSPGFLAANGSFAGLGFAFSDRPDQDQASPETKAVLDRFSMQLQLGNLTGPGGARDLLEQLKKTTTDTKLLDQRVAILAAALRDQGQEQITRYGTGDRFTVDPKWEETEAKAEDYQNAADAFGAVLELEPGAPDLIQIGARRHFCLGRIATISGDTTTASKEFELASSGDAKFAEPRNAQGVIDFQASRFEDALGQFNAAKALAPVWAYPRHNAALAYVERGRYDEALKEYRTAIEKTPYYPYLHYNLGVLLQRLNRPREAEARYRIALALFDAEAHQAELRAQNWGSAGNSEESSRADLQSRLLRRNIAAVYVALGSVVDQKKDAGIAARYYNLAHDRDPDFIAATHNLALLQKEQSQDLNSAAGLLEANLKQDPSFQPSRLALADTYLQLGRFADAERSYSEVGTGNLSALAGLAKALAGEGRTDEAIAKISAAIQAQKTFGSVSPELSTTLGDLYQTRGDVQAACAQFRSAAKTLKELPEENALEISVKQKLRTCKPH